MGTMVSRKLRELTDDDIKKISDTYEALRQKGIGCAQSQDREAQKKPRFSINELEKALNDSMN